MNSRRGFLSTLGLLTVGMASAPAAKSSRSPQRPEVGKSGGRLEGVRSITVEELARDLRKEPSQRRFAGYQIEFNASVLVGGSDMRVHINGIDNLGIANIHNLPKDVK